MRVGTWYGYVHADSHSAYLPLIRVWLCLLRTSCGQRQSTFPRTQQHQGSYIAGVGASPPPPRHSPNPDIFASSKIPQDGAACKHCCVPLASMADPPSKTCALSATSTPIRGLICGECTAALRLHGMPHRVGANCSQQERQRTRTITSPSALAESAFAPSPFDASARGPASTCFGVGTTAH